MTPLRLPLPGSWSVRDVLCAVRDEERPFALVGRWAGGSRAIVGASPLRVVEDGFPPPVASRAGEPGFVGGGWFGVLGFGLGRTVERLPPPPPRPVAAPDAAMGLYDQVLRLDDDGRWWFEALDDTPALRARCEVLAGRLAAGSAVRPWSLGPMTLHGGGAGAHRAAVAECVERIAAGELFQANLCVRLDGAFSGDAAEAFCAAASVLAPAHGAFVGRPGGAVLSFSPELFLRRTGRSVVTAPIKGTAPRSPSPAEAAAARAALAASGKDAAEHVMIVDLMRNDLGRVAAYGSVSADDAPVVEAHPGLWHLVSRVRGTLRPEVDDVDLLRATFPPGSVTGAPKVQALKVISELEGTAREAYTGAVGLVSPHAGLELNVAIRTLEVGGGRAWLGCGGGIVADSDPDAELREALGKARPIVEALGSRVPPVGPASPSPVLALPRLTRPDAALGLLATALVADGRVVALDRYLSRLAASAAAVYGLELDVAAVAARAASVAAAAGPGRARLRVLLSPGGAVEVESVPAAAPGPPADVVLRPATLAGGLGEHKWADRSPVAAEPGVLVVDLDGAVLEAGSANVWAIEGDALVTPPADGRLLRGVTRDRVLEALPWRCREEELTLDRLAAADGVVLTSSIRLATPAGLGAVTARARDVAAELRALLEPGRSGPPAPIRSATAGR